MDIKEIKNMSVPYDSPINVIFQRTIDSMASAFSKSMDDGVMTVVVKAGFDVDKEKLEQALTQDKCRYEEAYRRGYTYGYKKREDEIIRCRDCQLGGECDEWMGHKAYSCKGGETHDENWFCADGKPKDGDGE